MSKPKGNEAEVTRFIAKDTVKTAPPKMVKAAQLMAENGGKDKPLSKGKIMKEAGYSPTIQSSPSKITESPTFQTLLDEFMPDNDLATVHKRLLNTRKIEHMVFPLEHQDPSQLSEPMPIVPEMREAEIQSRRIIDNLSDRDIVDMLADVGCTVKKIIHGETARHVYWWAHDANAQTKALELAYKMKGHLNKAGEGSGDVFNFNGGQQFVAHAEVNNDRS